MGRPTTAPVGPLSADIMLVGDFAGAEDARRGEPFCDYNGKELNNLLHSAGLLRRDLRITNVLPYFPPQGKVEKLFLTKTEGKKAMIDEVGGRYPLPEVQGALQNLAKEISRTRPRTIVAVGPLALWALTGETSLAKYRGSELTLSPVWAGPYDPSIRVIPTYHPRDIMRNWDWWHIASADLKRAAQEPPKEPTWAFDIPQDNNDFLATQALLEALIRLADDGPFPIAADIETRERTFIDCIGVAWSPTNALCIPFFRASDYTFLWTPEEEAELILLLRRLFLHPNTQLIGQNWYYDAQYIARYWGFLAEPTYDTMVMQAVLYPGMQKSLDFLSSIWLPWHRYWKDDTAEAEAEVDDLKRWKYNCKDCCATYALVAPIKAAIQAAGLEEPLQDELSSFRPLMRAMMRGVKQDQKKKELFLQQLLEVQSQYEDFFNTIAIAWEDIPLAKSKTAKAWYRSPTQLSKLLYEVFKLPVQYHKKTKRPTTDDSALQALKKKEPLFLPLLQALENYRTIGIFLSTYILMPTDKDMRWRTSYNPVGTETFRYNSTSDAFDFGGNLQNISGAK